MHSCNEWSFNCIKKSSSSFIYAYNRPTEVSIYYDLCSAVRDAAPCGICLVFCIMHCVHLRRAALDGN